MQKIKTLDISKQWDCMMKLENMTGNVSSDSTGVVHN